MPSPLTSSWAKYSFCLLIISLLFFQKVESQQVESFDDYIKLVRTDSFSLPARKAFIKRCLYYAQNAEGDSLRYWRMSNIVEASITLNDSLLFQRVSSKSEELAKGNPVYLGDVHWNYGTYYLYNKNYAESYYHYNRAYTFFLAANNQYYAGKMLYNMAFIASEINDLTGAEILLYRSIKIFEETKKPLQQYRAYNLLGNNADDLKEYDKSLEYYRKAEQLIPLLKTEGHYRLENWNNLGVRLYKMELYSEAIKYFDLALKQSKELGSNQNLKAKLLDNRAFCEVSLGNYLTVLPVMEQALITRDSLLDLPGSVLSKLRFANYYKKTGDTNKAKQFAVSALEQAKSNDLLQEVLDALQILADLDSEEAVFYLQQHISLSKSLYERDRKLRNKFTAIQFQTDEYIAENAKLFKQRLWIALGALTVTLFLLLVFWNTRQKAKNKELLFEREQQQYNEDMFLMALEQKSNLEKGKLEERQRISGELHDAIVSRLFAIRFRWQGLSLFGKSHMLTQHNEYLCQLQKLEKDLRNLSYDLKSAVFIEADNFTDLLRSILTDKSEVSNFSYDFKIQNPMEWETLSYLAKINIQRIFEEVLHNVVKHAQASKVSVKMYRHYDKLHISIVDNGKGFQQSQIKLGIGLKSLENRSQKLYGSFHIDSKEGVGTEIIVQIPYKSNLA